MQLQCVFWLRNGTCSVASLVQVAVCKQGGIRLPSPRRWRRSHGNPHCVHLHAVRMCRYVITVCIHTKEPSLKSKQLASCVREQRTLAMGRLLPGRRPQPILRPRDIKDGTGACGCTNRALIRPTSRAVSTPDAVACASGFYSCDACTEWREWAVHAANVGEFGGDNLTLLALGAFCTLAPSVARICGRLAAPPAHAVPKCSTACGFSTKRKTEAEDRSCSS